MELCKGCNGGGADGELAASRPAGSSGATKQKLAATLRQWLLQSIEPSHAWSALPVAPALCRIALQHRTCRTVGFSNETGLKPIRATDRGTTQQQVVTGSYITFCYHSVASHANTGLDNLESPQGLLLKQGLL